MIKPPRSTTIPDILNVDEVQRLFLSYRVFFFTLYSLGLRISEGINLQLGDIDTCRQRVHIRNSKGNKDRLVPLPINTLQVLRQFWSVHRHPLHHSYATHLLESGVGLLELQQFLGA